MANLLPITSGNPGDSQVNTSNPQSVPGASGGPSTNSGNVQPGTTNTLLEAKAGGVALGNQNLTTVNLNPVTSSPVGPPIVVKTHHASPAMVGLVIGLFVLAIVAFVITQKSAKSTTNY